MHLEEPIGIGVGYLLPKMYACRNQKRFNWHHCGNEIKIVIATAF